MKAWYDTGMFRTRDFILVFTAVAFLLMAIGVTVFNQRAASNVSQENVFAQQLSAEGGAEIQNNSDFSRSEKLKSMRDKIALSSDLSISSPEPEPLFTEVNPTTTESVFAENTLQQCPSYQTYNGMWSPFGVQIEEVEGARLVYRVSEREVISTSSTPTVETFKDVVVQLPVRSFPAVSTSCVYSDVIGIANDGSLIRNSEVGVYGIFDSKTVVGYALDGFPIYGSGSAATDACGGVMGLSGYQYQISSTRDTIINCFSAAPVRI